VKKQEEEQEEVTQHKKWKRTTNGSGAISRGRTRVWMQEKWLLGRYITMIRMGMKMSRMIKLSE